MLKRALRLGVMVFNVIFDNISVISWRSVILVEETGGSGENCRPTACHGHFIKNFIEYTLS
jgi:hypothetical protein